jgi:exopolysaccharide biosynthesis polyprenyl glycosylphosphotransferase
VVQSGRRRERAHLRVAADPSPSVGVHIEERPEAEQPRSADPLMSIAVRAFALDVALLALGVSGYIRVMIGRGYLAEATETALYGAGLVIWWLVLILVRGGYEVRHLGVGSEEFKRVVTATVTLLAMISMASYVFKRQPPLRLVLPSMLIGLFLILMGRWVLRVWLGHQREAGRFRQATLVVGDRQRGNELAVGFERDAVAGFVVVGTVRPPTVRDTLEQVDEWLDEVMKWVSLRRVHAVAVAESRSVHPDLVRRLAWRLEGPGVDLLVSPALSDVAGPRVSVRPAAGLPLLHLDEPSLTGPKRALKRWVDLAIAVPLLILLSPLALLISLAIKLDTLGRVFYVSDRVGRSGEVFRCVKFRSMIRGADQQRLEVIGDPDEEIAERYREDPRVTRVGGVLRRWSLDELPQLLNVVTGSMSIVGPRPMLPAELELLGDEDHRRHLTKPGLTGLWQISGRKEVSWEDRMRMDLHYIENWSIALDLVIIVKTTKAVLTGHGAY